MKKGAIVVLVFSAVLILGGIGVIVGSFLSAPGYHMVRQSAYGYMVTMRMSYPMAMTLIPLMLTVLGSSLLVAGTVLLALGLYLSIQAKRRESFSRKVRHQQKEQPRAKKQKPEAEDVQVLDVEEKE